MRSHTYRPLQMIVVYFTTSSARYKRERNAIVIIGNLTGFNTSAISNSRVIDIAAGYIEVLTLEFTCFSLNYVWGHVQISKLQLSEFPRLQ
jgi:hypothetical protein